MFNLSDRMYDILKWVVGVVLPAIAALYGALAAVFAWPYAKEVSSTVIALVMFLGAFLQMSSASWAIERAKTMLDENNDGIPDYPFKMDGKVYETIKWMVQVALPALSVGYVALGGVWGWPLTAQIPTVVSAVVLFVSTILQFSSAQLQAAKAALK